MELSVSQSSAGTTSPIGGIALLALVGAAVATLCDLNHAYTGALSYPHPEVWIQPWWSFPGFFVAFVVMGVTYLYLAPLLSKTAPSEQSRAAGTARELVEALCAFALVYLASGFGHEHPLLLSALFYGIFLVRLLFTYERRWLLIVALILAVGGMVGEGLLSAFGLVSYAHQDIFYVPWWLGGLYVHGAFALREGMRAFVYRGSAVLREQ